jgi:predicted DNA-binding transcriptional regulator AlpA
VKFERLKMFVEFNDEDAAEPLAVRVRDRVVYLQHFRRGLNRQEAAQYVGVSASSFDKLVLEGKMPPPVQILKGRVVWDRHRVDQFFDELSDNETALNPWEALRGGA